MLPLEIVEEIFDYEGDSDALRRWKCVSKRFALRVKVHPLRFPSCTYCGGSRFRIGPRHMCFVRGCMSSDVIHPVCKFRTVSGKPLCSFGCLMAQRFSHTEF